MRDWLEFAVAFAVFFASHAGPLRPPMRPWLEQRLGRVGFTLGYSALSLGVLVWLIAAAGRAPFVPLWDRGMGSTHLVWALMALACAVLALGALRPNPFSFGGARNARFDAAQPGIVRLIRHPLLAALALWAGAHLIANGDLAHVILFGCFGAFAALGGRLIDRRKQRELGEDWHRLRAATAAQPLGCVLDKTTLPRLVVGGALFALLLWAHPFVIGVSPLP